MLFAQPRNALCAGVLRSWCRCFGDERQIVCLQFFQLLFFFFCVAPLSRICSRLAIFESFAVFRSREVLRPLSKLAEWLTLVHPITSSLPLDGPWEDPRGLYPSSHTQRRLCAAQFRFRFGADAWSSNIRITALYLIS